MLTEQRNPKTAQIDLLPTEGILRLINAEDASVAEKIAALVPEIAQAVDITVERLRSGGRLIYVGAGTSGRLGLLDAVECVPTFSTAPEMVQGLIAGGERAFIRAVEGAEDRAELGQQDLQKLNLTALDVVMGIAASGRTPYVIGALDYANEIGAATIALSCNTPAPILERAQVKIAVLVGPEVISGSTRMKAGTAQKMILNMISTATMIKLGKVYGNLMVDVQITNQKLAQRALKIVMEVAGVEEATAQKLLDESGKEVKTAIVMGLLNLSAAEARQHLAAHQGVLKKVIG